MDRFDGTAARQLTLPEEPVVRLRADQRPRPRPTLRLLQEDIYVELTRRRRRAQIAARRLLDRD